MRGTRCDWSPKASSKRAQATTRFCTGEQTYNAEASLAMVAAEDLEVRQQDVKMALYGLKQAPREN